MPSDTGSGARAEEWAIGAEPCPASFENRPRLTPLFIANAIDAPINPPTAAVPVNTVEKSEIMDGMMFW